MSVMNVRYKETLQQTLLFLCRTLSDAQHLLSSRSLLFYKIGVLKNFAEFT